MVHEEAAPLAILGPVLIDRTVLTEVVPREAGDTVVVVAATMVRMGATVTQHRLIKVPRKATWVATTIITSQDLRKISTIRTATMPRPRPVLVLGSTMPQTLLVAMTRALNMKVRLRVPI